MKQLQIVCQGHIFQLSEGQLSFLLGSNESADFRLSDPTIVAQHARFTRRGNAWRIEPLDGEVFVNLEKIEAQETIAIGDQLQIGSLTFRVNEQTATAPVAPKKGTPPNWIQRFIGRLPKPIFFGICGAIGCVIAAMLLGETFLNLTKLPPSPLTAQAIVLLIDCSDSMDAPKLQEVKQAASSFVDRQNLAENQIAVVGFGTQAQPAISLTQNKLELTTAISALSNQGGTVMHLGLEAAVSELASSSLERRILLFTDGVANDPLATLLSARLARVKGNNIIAIATGDAKDDYLARVTGSSKRVIRATAGNFEQAFQRSEEVISSLVEDNLEGDYSPSYRVLRIGGWTSFLAMGTSLALILGQSLYSRRSTILTAKEASLGILGGAMAGGIAGAAGETLSLPAIKILFFFVIDIISSGIGWVVTGTLLGGILSQFGLKVPFKQALTRGAIGGLVAAIAYSGGQHLSSNAGIFLGMASLFATAYLIGANTKIGCLGTIIAAAFALTISQFFTLPIETLVIIDILTRILGWTLLGLLLGAGMAQCVPNLKLSRGLIGGALGGAIGSIGFMMLKSGVNEWTGRAIGTAILGFLIGLMIAWAETLSREAWIEAQWTSTERRSFSLGTKPVIIGSSGNVDIGVSQSYPPVVAEVYMQGGQIVLRYDESMRNYGISVLEKRLKNKDIEEIADIKIEARIAKKTISP
jgi:Ca-activated chloride channel homolog